MYCGKDTVAPEGAKQTLHYNFCSSRGRNIVDDLLEPVKPEEFIENIF